MRVAHTRRWTRRHELRFEGIAESRARIWPRRGEHAHAAAAAPYCGSVACPRTGSVQTLDECLHCAHFVNLRPDADRKWATMRCLCCDDDPIAGRVPADALEHVVGPETPVAAARLLTWVRGAAMLVVARNELVVGVVYAHQLQDVEGQVGELMVENPWSITPAATLGDAVQALRELRVPGLLVVNADSELTSVICTADLRRMGVPAPLLPR